MSETIAKLVQDARAFSVNDNGSLVHDYFEQTKEAEGVVILDGHKPAGIIMRNDFYQKIGRQFGFSLYMRRYISLIMKTDIVLVDISCDIAKFGFIAMNRSKESLYDHIIMTENDNYVGVVSISEFLLEMSRTKEREIELLNNQQRILEQANIAEKQHSFEIEQKNISIRNLLDNAGQGFLSFSKDLILTGEHSRECDGIFGFEICNKSILDIFRVFANENEISLMQNVFESVFKEQDISNNRIYLSILPNEKVINKKHITIKYKIINNLSEKAIMMILTDITEKRALEFKNAEEKNNLKLVIRAISCKTEITRSIYDLHDLFQNELLQLINSGRDEKTVLNEIYRLIHTMKGDFSLNSLNHTSRALHELEDELAEMIKKIDTVNFDIITEFVSKTDSKKMLEKDINIISEALGDQYFGQEDAFTVSRERITEIEYQIKNILENNDQAIMLQLLNSLFYPNIKDLIKNYNDYTRAAAEKLGKSIENFIISGDKVYIDRNRYMRFTKTLVHIFRNIIDHGIETPDERVNKGKSESGEIRCNIEKYENVFVLNITDDGKGIDVDVIREKAIEKGIYMKNEISNLSRDEILETIFLDNFSTKDTVGMLSGRGVGLAAVRSELKDIGGTIKVETQPGKFTNFMIIIPLIFNT